MKKTLKNYKTGEVVTRDFTEDELFEYWSNGFWTRSEFLGYCFGQIQDAFRNQFGFAPMRKDIKITFAKDDRTEIDCTIGGHAYHFASWSDNFGAVWTGAGHVTQLN